MFIVFSDGWLIDQRHLATLHNTFCLYCFNASCELISSEMLFGSAKLLFLFFFFGRGLERGGVKLGTTWKKSWIDRRVVRIILKDLRKFSRFREDMRKGGLGKNKPMRGRHGLPTCSAFLFIVRSMFLGSISEISLLFIGCAKCNSA